MLPNGLVLDVHYDVQCPRPEVSGHVINRVYIKVQTLLISKPEVSGPVIRACEKYIECVF